MSHTPDFTSPISFATAVYSTGANPTPACAASALPSVTVVPVSSPVAPFLPPITGLPVNTATRSAPVGASSTRGGGGGSSAGATAWAAIRIVRARRQTSLGIRHSPVGDSGAGIIATPVRRYSRVLAASPSPGSFLQELFEQIAGDTAPVGRRRAQVVDGRDLTLDQRAGLGTIHPRGSAPFEPRGCSRRADDGRSDAAES